ncbi:Sodium/calcium exchanger protein-domain-containing protein [Cokeromyces recurvatus]|uniref:Sodium/calcium exchanger protein-domain-containing protein n=1 Tax=Cokeromyces recurvatus TaxID=90255 RepID=UPI00221FA0A8|nr:Sodium/calcium exchanger protein-domain-containing protein [Cokeromyces recurvatus]KAI7903608.1 Sodium/calcium exchanger protein-domain-containing protein [Cokeromyces recurvatus]
MAHRSIWWILFLFPCIVSASLLVPLSVTFQHHKTCVDIENHENQCAFVTAACHGFSGVFLKFYYCTQIWRPLSVLILFSGLFFLFGAVSVVAADFFCPNLQTISSRLQLSESMAGVTILAFGNGSPDLFSTFTAMDTGSGSLAVGELIGAAFFIVSVVSGCMGIIRPFQSKRITFMRDATFLTGAIMILTWIVYHQRIYWYHGVILICYYFTYVGVVVLGAYSGAIATITSAVPKSIVEQQQHDLLTETSALLQETQVDNRTPHLDIPQTHEFQSQDHLGHIIRPISSSSSYRSCRSSLHTDFPHATSTNGSISSRLYRHSLSPRVGMRTSLFSAIEFQEQVASIKRANSSTQLYTDKRHHSRFTHTSVPCLSITREQENVDHSSSAAHPISRTPESSYSPTGTHDYFAYISTSQQNHLLSPVLVHPTADDLLVPEIRLAPPNQEDNHHHESCFPLPKQQNSYYSKLKNSMAFSILLDDIRCILFPTLQDWNSKTTFAKLSALVALPLVLIFTLTLPVVEETNIKIDDIEVIAEESDTTPQVLVVPSPILPTSKSYLTVPEHSLSEEDFLIEEEISQTSWCRWLVAIQAICAITFVTSVLALNGFINIKFIFLGFLIGCLLSIFIFYKTKVDEAPKWYWTLSIVGFYIALNWIFLLANEMVGLLQALGAIFNVSEAIMGLTIFALGNSVGDLVANTAIAKMGFPTMAISACYAGPLLNMVLGIGISSTYQTWITGKPYELDIAPSILISCAGLIAVLISTLLVVNINGYHITKHLGWWMIIVYSTCTIFNLLLEFHTF